MAILIDTNVLLRLAQQHHPHSTMAARATEILDARNETLLIAQQSMVEFWSVSTRPFSANGLGFSIERTRIELDRMRRLFHTSPERPLHEEWERLVVRYRVSGKSVHDARLVATMIVHGAGAILTFNVQISPAIRKSPCSTRPRSPKAARAALPRRDGGRRRRRGGLRLRCAERAPRGRGWWRARGPGL